MSRSYVYWIRKEGHTNVMSEGYVGVTSQSVEVRWKEHIRTSRRTNGRNVSIIHKAIRSYGADNLIVETLCVGSERYCYELEKRLRPEKKIGWNLAIGGSKPPGVKGLPVSQETREKLSKALKGRKVCPESVARGVESRKWYKATEEHRRRLSEAGKGRKMSQKSLDALIKRNKSMKGKKRSEESILKGRATRTKTTRWWRFKDAYLEFWAHADWFHGLYLHGLTAYTVHSYYSGVYNPWSVGGLWKHFKEGWVPAEDPNWIQDFRSSDSKDYPFDKSLRDEDKDPFKRFEDFKKFESLLSEGVSVRRAAQTLGIGSSTAYRYKRLLLKDKDNSTSNTENT